MSDILVYTFTNTNWKTVLIKKPQLTIRRKQRENMKLDVYITNTEIVICYLKAENALGLGSLGFTWTECFEHEKK